MLQVNAQIDPISVSFVQVTWPFSGGESVEAQRDTNKIECKSFYLLAKQRLSQILTCSKSHTLKKGFLKGFILVPYLEPLKVP